MLFVIALAAAVAGPVIGRTTDGMRMRTEVAGFSATLRHAREQAVTTQRPHRVEVNPAEHRMTVIADEADVRLTRSLAPELTMRGQPAPRPHRPLRGPRRVERGRLSSQHGRHRLPGQRGSADRTRARLTPVSLPTSSRRSAEASSAGGFTLLEVLIALAILGTAVVASIQGVSQGLRLLKAAGDQQQAIIVADQKARELLVPIEGTDSGTDGRFSWQRTSRVLETPELTPAECGPAVARVPDLGDRHVGRAAPPRGLDPAHRAGHFGSHARGGGPSRRNRAEADRRGWDGRPRPALREADPRCSSPSPRSARVGRAHRSSAGPGGAPGFTLVELIIALAIVATLLVIAFGGLRVVLGATQRSEERIEVHQHLRSLTTLLTRSVGAAFPYRGPLGEAEELRLLFRGQPSTLEFVTQAPPFPLDAPIAFTAVVLSHVEGEGLVIRERALPNHEPFAAAAVVLRDAAVTSLAFRYLDETNGWQTEWEDEDRPPSAVEITVGLTLNGRPETLPAMVVPLQDRQSSDARRAASRGRRGSGASPWSPSCSSWPSIGLLGAEFAYSMRLEARAARNFRDAVTGRASGRSRRWRAPSARSSGQGTLVAEAEDGLLTFYTPDRLALKRLPREAVALGDGQYSYRITDEAARINVNSDRPARPRSPAAAPGRRQAGARRHRRLHPGLARRQRRASRSTARRATTTT